MSVSLTTVIFEIVNFIVLLWLLKKILYEPLRRALRERQRVLDEERSEARLAREGAEALQKGAEQERGELALLRDRMHSEMRLEVEEERRELLKRASEDADARRAHARSRLEEERDELHREAEALVIDRSAALAGQLLARLGPDVLHAALTDQVCAAIERAHGDGEALFRAGAPMAVEVATAHPLDPAVTDRIERALTRMTGARVEASHVRDESLIAGVVIRAGDQVFDGSARTQLEAFQRLARQHLAESPRDQAA